MKLITKFPESDFEVIAGTRRSQAAVMVIAPGASEGGRENRHEGDQWLYVLAGTGKAIVEGKEVPLASGALLLIEAGERHQIHASGEAPLSTLNFYAPPQF